MSETGNSDKTVTAAPPKATLHLKRPVEQGTVRQSFSHGRSKAVVVEKVKRRILTPGETPAGARPATASPDAPSPVAPSPAKPPLAGAARAAPAAPAKPTAPPPPKTGVVLPTLTAEQREARARALSDARAQRGGGSPPPGGGGRGPARARGARPPRTRGRGGAQARGRASPRAGSQFQAAVRGRGAPAPFRRRTGAIPVGPPRRAPDRAQRSSGRARPSRWRRRGRSAAGR